MATPGRDLVDDQVDALAAGRLLDLVRPFGVARIEREVAAEFLQPRAAAVVGRGAHDDRGAHVLGDLHAQKPDARAGALDQHRLALLEAAGADQRVVHGLHRHRHAGGLLVGHVVGRDLVGAAGVGDGVFGEAAGGRAHHAIARLEVLDVAAHRLDLAGAFQADDGAGAAHRAVAVARRDREVGAVERGRAHLDQDLVRLGHGLGDVADLDAIFSDHGCFHLPSVMQALPADYEFLHDFLVPV